jgi:hypothetical protein
MPWIAPVVAYVDGVGRLLCVDCCENPDACIPMDGDNSAVEGETCQYCSRRMHMVRASDYIHVDAFPARDERMARGETTQTETLREAA